MGQSEQVILRQAKLQKGPIPERILNAPQLEVGLEWYYEAFGKLTTCRSIGMGAGPIPWTAMNDYGIRYGLDGEEQDDFEYLIGAMDDAYLKHAAAQQEKKSAAATPRTPLKANSRRR